MSSTLEAPELTAEQRSEILARAVSERVRQGWRVISQTQTQAQLAKGKPTSHLLHFVLGLFTLGLWWITVWPLVAIFGGEKHRLISVTETGEIL